MPEPASPTVFVSYRRQDASGEAGRLCDRLEGEFGQGRVFFDVDSIAPGADFHRELERALHSCTVFLPVIGQRWLTVANEKGVRRLDDPEDFVRVEIAASLARDDIIIIPVLVQDAEVPRADNLPADLQALVKRQFFRLTHEQFASDVRRLIEVIKRAHGARPAEVPPAARIEPPADPVPAQAASDDGWRATMAAVVVRRKRQLEDHLNRAEAAIAAGDYEAASAACEEAALVDLQDRRVQDLMERARAAIHDRQMRAWMSDARRHLEAGSLSEASNAVDEALTRDPGFADALTLRQQLLQVRRERELQRERDQLVAPALDRARVLVAEGKFDEALASADEALAIDAGYKAALELRARTLEAVEVRRRQGERAAHLQRGLESFNAGKFREALDAANGILSDDPANDEARELKKAALTAQTDRRRQKRKFQLPGPSSLRDPNGWIVFVVVIVMGGLGAWLTAQESSASAVWTLLAALAFPWFWVGGVRRRSQGQAAFEALYWFFAWPGLFLGIVLTDERSGLAMVTVFVGWFAGLWLFEGVRRRLAFADTAGTAGGSSTRSAPR